MAHNDYSLRSEIKYEYPLITFRSTTKGKSAVLDYYSQRKVSEQSKDRVSSRYKQNQIAGGSVSLK